MSRSLFCRWETHQDLVHRGREVPGNPEAALGRQALDNLISRLLVYQASQEKGYRVEPYRVEEAVRSYRAGFPDEASYRRTLQRFMYTPESFRQYVERGLIVEKFHDEEIAPTVKITEEEIRRYYEEIRQYFVQVPARVHVRHILIEVPLGVSEADKAAALEKMRGGALRGAAAGGRRDRNPAAARAGDVWRAVVRGAHPVRHRGVAGVAAASRNFRTRRNFKTAPG
jgi:hypothetical protein